MSLQKLRLQSTRSSKSKITKEMWQNKNEQIFQIEQEIDQINPTDDFDFQAKQLQREKAKILFMRREMEMGKFPEKYQFKLIFIYAKSFLYSLDRIDKLFRVMKDEKDSPTDIAKAYNKFKLAFPNLRGVRNSSAHIEERIRGLAKNKPIFPNGGDIELENLSNNKFSSVMEDGRKGEVEVSFNSITSARDCIQIAINSFNWVGSPKISP